jgi:hypothetical protein
MGTVRIRKDDLLGGYAVSLQVEPSELSAVVPVKRRGLERSGRDQVNEILFCSTG